MCVALALGAGTSSAQTGLPVLPGDLVDPERLHGRAEIVVNGFQFRGNTVFSDARLDELLSSYVGKTLDSAALETAREAISALYVENGYLSSGALLPDQEVVGGIVRFDIVEGVVSEVRVEGLERLREGYVTQRLLPPSPFRIQDLRERIERLQRGGLVARVDASIEPGERRGQALVGARVVEEPRPYSLAARISNHVSPSVGGLQFEVLAEHRNLTGWGDRLGGRLGFSRGATEFEIGWSVPLNRFDTTLSLSLERSNSGVVSEPFNILDITSVEDVASVSLDHPVVRSRKRDVDVSLGLARRSNQTSLLGFPFSFSPGAKDGRTSVTVLSATQTWTERSEGQVMALSSSFNLGVDWFGASDVPGAADGRYFTWLGQAQWFRRIDFLDSQLLVRGSAQLASDHLLPSEKFALGGVSTVRGYRENQINRDNAVNASVEWRIPLGRFPFPGTTSNGELLAIPFFDYGRGWESETTTPRPTRLASVGAGLVWKIAEGAEMGVFWGHRLRRVPRSGERDLQDEGIHVHLMASAF
jgi:hemolysin activation/secretion protein